MKKTLNAKGSIEQLLKYAEDALIAMGFFNIAYDDVTNNMTGKSEKYGSIVITFGLPEAEIVRMDIDYDVESFIVDFKKEVNLSYYSQTTKEERP